LQILHRPRKAIDTSDDERVALTEELEQGLQFSALLQARRRGLLFADNMTTSSFERLPLDRYILID
jgi:hypothetical protein